MRARLGQGTGGLLVKGECPACGFFLTFFFLNKKLTHALVTHLNKMFVLKLKVFPIINNLVLFSRAGFLKVGVTHTDLILPKGRDLTRLFILGFPCGSVGKESICDVGDLGLIPGLERFPGEGKGYPLQYSGLENSMDYTWVPKSQT